MRGRVGNKCQKLIGGNVTEITTELLQASSIAKALESPVNKAILEAVVAKIAGVMAGSPVWAGVAAFALLTESARVQAEEAGQAREVGDVETN